MGRSDARLREQESKPSSSARQIREQFYDITGEEMNALRLVGSFRSVEAKDMPSERLGRLLAAGLLEKKSLLLQRASRRADVLVLTRLGRQCLRDQAPPGNRQRYYAGLVKP